MQSPLEHTILNTVYCIGELEVKAQRKEEEEKLLSEFKSSLSKLARQYYEHGKMGHKPPAIGL
jgi:hypothetical protein